MLHRGISSCQVYRIDSRIMGTAPSAVLKRMEFREIGLINDIQHQHETNVANGPLETNSHPGSATGTLALKIAKEGARTIPEDQKMVETVILKPSRGSKCYLPVYVDGAKLSVDLHFSQGDGEISFAGN